MSEMVPEPIRRHGLYCAECFVCETPVQSETPEMKCPKCGAEFRVDWGSKWGPV